MKDPTLYVPVHAGLFSHRKLRRLAARLSIQQVHAVGHLVGLWTTALQQTTDGVLRRWDELDVADAARWTGKPSDLVDALVAEEWLDRAAVADGDIPAGTLRVRGWDDYAGRGLAMREREKKRKADQRAKGKGGTSADNDGLSADNDGLSADNDGLSADVPPQLSEAKLSEADLNEADRNEAEERGAGAPALVEPEVLRPQTRALEKARTDVIRDNRNDRNHKKARAEAIYDRPQSINALLAFVVPKGGTVGEYLAKKFPLFDDKEGRPSVADRVAALWNAFEGQRWGISGEDAIRWLVARLSEDHQKLKQSEMIVAEKKARGVSLPQEQVAPTLLADDQYRWNDYCANTKGRMPTLAEWREAGRPSPATPLKLQGSGGPPQLPPSSTAVNAAPPPAGSADDVDVAADKERAFAALDALADAMSGRRRPSATPSPAATRRQMAREFARAALVARGIPTPTDVEVMDHIVALGGVDAIVDGAEGEGDGAVGGGP